jgi:HEAT repeat protein
MRKSVVLCAIIAVLVASAGGLAAQEKRPAGSKELTIEELFLKSIEFQILREKAFSEDYEIKMGALDDLDKKISEGSIGDNSAQVEFVLEYLAMEGSGRTARESGRLVNYFPEVRRRAANMLGRIGTEAAKDALIRVLLIDEEDMVKAEAAYALGVVGLNKDNEVVKVLAFALDREDPSRPDNNFAYATALAIEKLAQKGQGTIDPAAYRTLVKIAQGNYLRTVKAKALQVLEQLKKPR